MNKRSSDKSLTKTVKLVPKSADLKIKTSDMIIKALESLKGTKETSRKGTSLQAIKKFIVTNFDTKMDTRLNNNIKKYIKAAVQEGILIQKSGIGASGSFKLAGKSSSETLVKSASLIKIAVPKKTLAAKRAIEESEHEKTNKKNATNAKKQKTR